MKFPIDWHDKATLRAMFSTAVRYGCAPAFGSRPIGWYQQHVCAALDVLEEGARKVTGFVQPAEVEIRLFHGMLQAKTLGPNATRVWRTFARPAEVWSEADKRSRL